MDYMQNRQAQGYSAAVEVDEGLRSYMLRVFNYMAGALGVTGAVAWLTSNSPAMMNVIFGTPLVWVLMFAPLIMSFFFAFRIAQMQVGTAKTLFWAFSAVMGLSMASIFMVFTAESVARVFFITAAVFGGMSLFGYSTKKDLTSMGSFLIMGVWGILIASIVNIFMQSSAMQFAISVISVLVFTGLTAYDTQKLKQIYYMTSGDMREKSAIMGALNLYFDFIIIFQNLLHLFGNRR